jgi:hypothetical protein
MANPVTALAQENPAPALYTIATIVNTDIALLQGKIQSMVAETR